MGQMSLAEIQAELSGIDLAWWPEFLLTMDPPTEEDSFTVSLATLASCLAEEDSLS